MLTNKWLVVRISVFLIFYLFSFVSWAVTCNFLDGYGPINKTMPLFKNSITVGRDVPIGTTIYSQTYKSFSRIKCDGPSGAVKLHHRFTSLPKPLTGWSGGNYYNFVYESGLPGIGIAIKFDGGDYPNFNYMTMDIPYATELHLQMDNNVMIDFIKIGQIFPGVIRSSDLPSTTFEIEDDKKLLEIGQLNFSGSINIVSQTCKTPDLTVSLGSQSIEPLVSGERSETERKDFSIVMRDCPYFYGSVALNPYRGDFNNTTDPIWDPVNGLRQFNEVPNDIKISFTPKNGVLDSNAMIAKLDPIQPGNAPVAQGIGIALYDSSGTRYKFDNHFVNAATPAIGSSSDIHIPLRAAYTYDVSKPRTEIKAGYGYAAIEFTIQYN